MKKYFLFIPFLLLVSLLHAQEDSVISKIEYELHNCLADTIGTIGQYNCIFTAKEKFDSLILNKYKVILEILPENDKVIFIESQKIWEEYKIADLQFFDKVETLYFNSDYKITIYPPLLINKELSIVKARYIELSEFYKLLSVKY
jgi:hypothetical protein